MRYTMLAPILFLTSAAFANSQPVSCELAKSSIVGRSSAGLAQVSNLALIEVKCSVPARPFPGKPGEVRNGLKATTTAYGIAQSGHRKEVPSNTTVSGGGEDAGREYVDFYLFLPLDPAERQREMRRYIANLRKSAGATIDDAHWQQLESSGSLSSSSDLVSQHRAGHFRVQCRILDGTRVMGVGILEFDVLFKGRFSDFVGFPGYWQEPPPKTEP